MTEPRYHRREFLARAGQVAAAGWLARPAAAAGWDDMRQILDRIKAPAFPDRDFNVTRYGAVADGKTGCTGAIARAIDECSRAGGGRVTFPAGVWLTGPIHLKSNVNLHVPEGATIKFMPDPKLYLPVVRTRWEGTELLNYSPLIYSDGQENLAITGEGVLDGQADCEHWWPWSGSAACRPKSGDPNARAARDALTDMGAKDIPVEKRVFGEGFYLRPPLLQPCRSKNILIEGVTITNSPMWVVTPLYCTNVTVRGVKVVGHGPAGRIWRPSAKSREGLRLSEQARRPTPSHIRALGPFLVAR
jgi:polygalacturonase